MTSQGKLFLATLMQVTGTHTRQALSTSLSGHAESSPGPRPPHHTWEVTGPWPSSVGLPCLLSETLLITHVLLCPPNQNFIRKPKQTFSKGKSWTSLQFICTSNCICLKAPSSHSQDKSLVLKKIDWGNRFSSLLTDRLGVDSRFPC